MGLAFYAISFFLAAVGSLSPGSRAIPGYFCAWFALAEPLQSNPYQRDGIFEHKLIEYVSLLIAGWINPLFLTFVGLAVYERLPRIAKTLRIVVPLMIPFCWIVVGYEHFFWREGHILWIAGMLMVLFSKGLLVTGGTNRRSEALLEMDGYANLSGLSRCSTGEVLPKRKSVKL